MAIQSANNHADKKATVNIANGIIKGVTPLGIKMGTTPNQQIEWSIDSSDPNTNYTFPDNGIEIKPGTDPDAQFTKIGPIANGKKYQLHDRNSDAISYSYTVRIMNGTTPLPPLDPTIDNGQ